MPEILDLPTVDVRETEDWGYEVGKHFADDDYVGFCLLRPEDEVLEQYEAVQSVLDAFMDLPLETRKAYMAERTGGEVGFTPQDNAERNRLEGEETSDGSNPFRSYHVARDVRRPGPGQTGAVPPELWDRYPRTPIPDEIEQFEETVYEAYGELEGLVFDLLEGISAYVESAEGTRYALERGFQDYARHGHHILRMLDYPAKETLERDDPRIGAHEDQGLVTVLWTDNTIDGPDGLQVLAGDDPEDPAHWKYVDADDDELVINIGEELAYLSNDFLPATKHGVTATTTERRQSLPFFAHSGPNTMLKPHQAFLIEDGLNPDYFGQQWKEFMVRDNVDKRTEENWPVQGHLRSDQWRVLNEAAWEDGTHVYRLED